MNNLKRKSQNNSIYKSNRKNKNKKIRNNLTQEVKDLYNKTNKILLKESKDIPYSWLGRINTIMIYYYPKKSIDSMQFLSMSQ